MIDYLKNSKGLMCPQCRSEDFEANGTIEEGLIKCNSCLQKYIVKNQVASLVNKESDNYNAKYKQRYAGDFKKGSFLNRILKKIK